MGRERGRALSARVEAVQRRIEHWRTTREKRTAMPEDLWQAAASVARVHGTWRISQVLRVNYESLKRRVRAPSKGKTRRRGGPARFVELNPGSLMSAPGPAGTVLELSRGDGAKLTIRVEGTEVLDVAALVDAFWRGET